MGRLFRLSLPFLGAIAWAIACGPGLPSGGHASGGGKGGGGGTGGGGGGTDGGGDAGCALIDGGCMSLGNTCSVNLPNGGCYSGFVCSINTDGNVYTCQLPSADGGCDGGVCLGEGQSCDDANPDNGGCAEGLECVAASGLTGSSYTCEPPVDAGN